MDELVLTGESVSVLKTSDAAEKNAILSERTSMLYKGTVVTDGSGEGVVTAIGMETELGNISNLADQAVKKSTPLQKKA